MASPPSDSQNPETQSPPNPQNPPSTDPNDPEKPNLDDESEQSEEGECGFCLYMKAGGCRENFTAWEDCVNEAEEKEEDVVEKCSQITHKLKLCMEAHEDYYAPILRAEKAAEAQVKEELEMEKKEEEVSKNLEMGSGN